MYYCSYIIIEIYCNIYYTILCTIYCTKNYITSYICLLEIVLGGEEPLLMDWCHVFTFSKTMFYQQGGLPPLDSVSVMDLFKGFQPITEYIYYYYYQYEVTNQNHSKLIARVLIRACGLEKFSKNN